MSESRLLEEEVLPSPLNVLLLHTEEKEVRLNGYKNKWMKQKRKKERTAYMVRVSLTGSFASSPT